MIAQIGEMAGIVWHFVSEHPGVTTGHIRKELKVEDQMLHLALGWLAREGKLQMEAGKKTIKISLAGD